MSNTKEEPFLLSPYQMAEVKKLTEELKGIHKTVKERNDQINTILGAFKEPIKETHEKVYHVSGFKLKAMFDILFGKGLSSRGRDAIYYNIDEIIKTAYIHQIFHISIVHIQTFWHTSKRARRRYWVGPIWFRIPHLNYIKRFGLLPLAVTYEIDAKNGFETDDVYVDRAYDPLYLPSNENRETTILRCVKQNCIPSQYIRLKAITLALPMFGLCKVLWRRK